MKIAERVALPQGSEVTDHADDARTRDRVRRGVLELGPVTASELAEHLGLTPAAVRRHLDGLLASELIAPARSPNAPRGRGRPARHFVLTAAGHAAGATGYDELAVAALSYLEAAGGPGAVRDFARARVLQLESRYRPSVEAAGADPAARAEALAAALSRDGYAASTRSLEGPEDTGEAGETGMASLGTQLCQGHCPVQAVAERFPQLCEAETEAFGRMLGVHVQRLATLAHGEHVCTTHVPPGPSMKPPVKQQDRQTATQERTAR